MCICAGERFTYMCGWGWGCLRFCGHRVFFKSLAAREVGDKTQKEQVSCFGILGNEISRVSAYFFSSLCLFLSLYGAIYFFPCFFSTSRACVLLSIGERLLIIICHPLSSIPSFITVFHRVLFVPRCVLVVMFRILVLCSSPRRRITLAPP